MYLLATSVQNAFTYVVDLTGLLFAIFYVLTALAAIVYYRRRVFANVWDAVVLGVLPLASAAFLVWMVEKSLVEAEAPERWSLVGVVAVGLVLMLAARFGLKSWFYGIRLESAPAAESGRGQEQAASAARDTRQARPRRVSRLDRVQAVVVAADEDEAVGDRRGGEELGVVRRR